MNRFTFIFAVVLLAGCTTGNQKPSAADAGSQDESAPVQQSDRIVNLTQSPTVREYNPKDAQPNVMIVFRLECYQITLPYGAISRNEAFWKRLNEQCVRQDTYDLLFKNGFRVGTAPFSEWDGVKEFIQQNPGTVQTMATIGAEMKNLELEMKKGLLSQNIFAFDQGNELVGRTYERCDNLFSLSYQKAPRKYGEVRVAIAPTVRSTIKRIFATALNNEFEIEERKPTSYYLGLTVDIPVDSFVVLSPSAESSKATSLGNAFLVNDGAAEQSETILVVLARPFRTDDAASSR